MKHIILTFALALCCYAQSWADRNAAVVAMRTHIGSGQAEPPLSAAPNGLMVHVRPHLAAERLLVVAFYVEAGEPQMAWRWTPVWADAPFTVVALRLSAGARLTSVTVEGYAGERGVWWSEYVVPGEEGQEW